MHFTRSNAVWLVLMVVMLFAINGVTIAEEASPEKLTVEIGEANHYLFSLTEGKTVADKKTGLFERSLLGPPDDGVQRILHGTWVLDCDTAVTFAKLSTKLRKRVLRQHLNLAPNEPIIWEEMSDVIFNAISSLERKNPKTAPFDMWVSFPHGKEAKVDLLFTETIEKELQKDMQTEMTKIEGFIYFPKEIVKLLPDLFQTLEVKLLDDNEVIKRADVDENGYFVVEGLADEVRDDVIGEEYKLALCIKGTEKPVGTIDVSLVYGSRTRVDLLIAIIETRDRPTVILQPWGTNIPMPLAEGPDIKGYAGLLQGWQAAIVKGLAARGPKNPGVHAGAVVYHGDTKELYAFRYPTQTPKQDTSPKVAKGAKMRLECWVPKDKKVAEHAYLRIVLYGEPSKKDLDLSQRPWKKTPWAVLLGGSDGFDSTLYVIGMSYKSPWYIEPMVGVGLQSGRSEAFVYGGTIEIGQFLDALLGKKESEKK